MAGLDSADSSPKSFLYSQFCMPDEARDGRNVALNLTSVHGVLDCPKKNQAITPLGCSVCSSTMYDSYLFFHVVFNAILCWSPN